MWLITISCSTFTTISTNTTTKKGGENKILPKVEHHHVCTNVVHFNSWGFFVNITIYTTNERVEKK